MIENQRPTIVFDFDGTLVDSIAVNHEIMNKLAQRFHFKSVDADTLKALKQKPAREVLRYFGIVWYKVPLVMAFGKRMLSKRIQELSLHPDIAGLFAQLSGQCNIGIVSTNSAKNVASWFRYHQLPTPDFIKADVSLFGKKRVLRRLKRRIGEFLYVGDELRDIEAARHARVPITAVTWGYNSAEVIGHAAPDNSADNIQQLRTILMRYVQNN